MANKLINCKTCGAEMASNAKVCPQCGAKNKKPIFKKWWFWVLVVIIIGSIIGGSSGSKNTPSDPANNNETTQGETAKQEEPVKEEESITYTHYNVTDLFDALEDNALKASGTFKGQYVEIEGYLGTIDSSGSYICVGAGSNNYDYFLQDVQCYVKSDEQLAQIMEMSTDDPIVVRGKITDVGEILGYSLNIDSIN